MTSRGRGVIGRRGIAGLLAAAAGASAMVAVSTPGAAAQTASAERPATTVRVTLALRPTPRNGAHAASGPVILCYANFGQYPHFSKKYKDISWHYTWTCDDPSASAYGRSTLYYDNLPVAHQSGRQWGVKGDFNVRYQCRAGSVWPHGAASITFSAPYHTSATVEGASRARKTTC